jgi:hypothetical protein
MPRILTASKNALSLVWLVVERAAKIDDFTPDKYRSMVRIIDLLEAKLGTHPANEDTQEWNLEYDDHPHEPWGMLDVALEDADGKFIEATWQAYIKAGGLNGLRAGKTAKETRIRQRTVLELEEDLHLMMHPPKPAKEAPKE